MESVYEANELVLAFVYFALMLIASEAGFRLGPRSGNHATKDTKSQHLTVEAGILGVLGLLLGFTMSMALSRFEIRKHLVLEEAQAIGAAYLFTQLLPVDEGKEIADLLRAYANVRIRGQDARDIYEQITAARQESSRLQEVFWRRAIAYGQKEPNVVRAGLLLQSLKEVIQLDAARWMAFQDHVPAMVIYAIAIVGLLAVMTVGYTFGLSGLRQPFSICMLSLAITLVLAIIVDVDRPREGLIRVSQQPLLDLQKQLRPR
jgi:cellobiose-specific phosphotransferase system component IIC